MTVVTSRAEFEQLIDLRLRETKLLLNDGDWNGAYYLAGYAVEFALKVKLITELMKTNAFPEKRVAEIFYRHELDLLRKTAGLETEMEQDVVMKAHWRTVREWSEQSRYRIDLTEQMARLLLATIENEVLPWIKSRW